MGSDARLDRYPLDRFDTEWTQDILYLTCMSLSLSFEKDFTVFID